MKPFVIPSHDRARLRKSVLEALRQGRSQAIPGYAIASKCGQKDDRLVRIMIRELIAEGIPIAASVSDPMGYFIVNTDEEATEYMRVLKERIKEDQSRLNDFEKAVSSFNPPEQLELLTTGS